jgi:hypothetical protein
LGEHAAREEPGREAAARPARALVSVGAAERARGVVARARRAQAVRCAPSRLALALRRAKAREPAARRARRRVSARYRAHDGDVRLRPSRARIAGGPHVRAVGRQPGRHLERERREAREEEQARGGTRERHARAEGAGVVGHGVRRTRDSSFHLFLRAFDVCRV